jgi:hypothetical protein
MRWKLRGINLDIQELTKSIYTNLMRWEFRGDNLDIQALTIFPKS